MPRPLLKTILLLMALLPCGLSAQQYKLVSPDGNLRLLITHQNGFSFSVFRADKIVVNKVVAGLTMNEGRSTNHGKLAHKKFFSGNDHILAEVPCKQKNIDAAYNALTLKDNNGFRADFRLYNDGFAYRFADEWTSAAFVKNETLEMSFPDSTMSWFPEEESMYSHNERLYKHLDVSAIGNGRFCSLPVLFQAAGGTKILLTETALHDYPNMFLQKTAAATLSGVWPKVVLEAVPNAEHGPDRNQLITAEAAYIARTGTARDFPWRVFIIGDEKTLIESTLAYQLARPPKDDDYSWVKPGKVAWDWYNANNIFGVDFASGLNTATYKYYIDFAAENGIEYVILDEGWTKSTTEIMAFNPDMDVQELIRYGESKGVGIILWVLWKPLNDNMEEILTTYKSWGAKGIKVDFMQRSDQEMVRSYEAIAALAARLHLLVDFHGAFKPQGLQRSYPNVLNFEGVMGAENNKWSKHITPDHNLTIPFIRMAAGPMDYTPGAMVNGGKDDFAIRWNRPMSQGTRAHQVAMYVVYEAPLQMLCESPSVYRREQETVDFITGIPTTWDETRVLEAAIGDYLVLTRRKGDDWYIGGMTDWEARTFIIPTHFLRGSYDVVSYADGMNAEKFSEDYRILKHTVTSGDTLRIEMKPGGGFAAILHKKHDF